MTDPWLAYEQEFIDELRTWPRPFYHRIFDYWQKIDSTVVELLKGMKHE